MLSGDQRGGAKVVAVADAWAEEDAPAAPKPVAANQSARYSANPVTDDESEGLLYKLRTRVADTLPNRGNIDAVDVNIAGYGFPLALLFHVSFLFFLIYVTMSEYNTLIDEKFLSPEINSGSVCEPIPVANNADFGIDLLGQWDNSKDFNFTSAIYTLSFKGLDVSEQEYYEIIELHRRRLEALSGRVAHRDLAYELIALCSFSSKAKVDLVLNANPELVFNVPIRNTYKVDTNPKRSFIGSYNKGSSELTITLDASYSYEELFARDPTQPKTFIFDIRSVNTAIAVNLGIMSITDLEEVAGLPIEDGPRDFVGDMMYYVDSHYGDMAPILCYNGAERRRRPFCFIRSPGFEKSYQFPMIFQIGDTTSGRACDCDNLGANICNSMDIAINFVVFPQVRNDPYLIMNDFMNKLITLLPLNDQDADKALTSLLHRAFSASVSANISNQAAVMKEMCNTNCSMISMVFQSNAFPTLNSNGMQFTNLYEGQYRKCSDVLFKGNLFQRMEALPPAPLIENYYICHLTSSMAIQRAIGVAAGTSSLYASLILTGSLSFFVTWYNKVNGKGAIPTRRSKQLKLQRQLDELSKEVELLKNGKAF